MKVLTLFVHFTPTLEKTVITQKYNKWLIVQLLSYVATINPEKFQNFTIIATKWSKIEKDF